MAIGRKTWLIRLIPQFDFGIVEQGYGWVFPKGDHLNVGICSKVPANANRNALNDYLQEKLGTATKHRATGFPVTFTQANRQKGNTILIGDAAGYVEQLLGEGIGNAAWSARLAADAVMHVMKNPEVDLGECYNRLGWKLRYDLKLSALFSAIFYRFPKWVGMPLLHSPLGWCWLNGYASGRRVTHIVHQFPMPFVWKPTIGTNLADYYAYRVSE